MISSTADFITPLVWGLAEATVGASILAALAMLAVAILLELAVKSICLFLEIED
jgi:hypothetical protein